MDPVIEIRALSKNYGRVRAVDAVDLSVARGEIYGFLGLNGAGKTTTIRALLGMVRPSAGSIRVLGQAVGPNGRGPWDEVGYLVGRTSAYPELTVWENLEIARRLHRIDDARATTRAIEMLKLGAYAERKAGALSTGNLQRLGLARALLHDPSLIILDEPANGLDPAGVVEIRELLEGLAHNRKVTVFMSSHILSEVDKMATRIGIIHNGKLVEELRGDQLETLRMRRLEIVTQNLVEAEGVLRRAGYEPQTDNGMIQVRDERAVTTPEEIASILVHAHTPPSRLVVVQEDLEDYFLRITGDQR